MTTLIFVRHGEADGNYIRRFHGFFNSNLTEKGLLQISRAAERLSDTKIDAFYSSDLRRAYQTAQKVAQGRNMTITTDERLREINGGEWEDVPWDDLPARFPDSYADWLNAPYKLQMPGGESMKEFSERLVAAVHDIVKKHEGETVCIACHGTAIRVLACYFYGFPLEKLTDVAWCDNASVTIVTYDNGAFTVALDGDNSHLKDISTIENQAWWKNEQTK